LVFLTVLTIAVLAFAQAAHAHGTDSHGNQGSVKVDDDDIDDGPSNHPHVICGLVIVVQHGFGAPFDIDFDAQSPTTRAGGNQHLLIVHVPLGDNVSGLIDLRAFVGGIVANPQGFHVFITVHLPGGDKHKVIWVQLCPEHTPVTTSNGGGTTTTTAHSGATTTTAHSGTTTTTATGASTTTSSTAIPGAVSNDAVPTQVLGESFQKSPAAAASSPTSLASTGSQFPPALAVGLVFIGLGVLGGARHLSGRHLELSMRKVSDQERKVG
jgi:hypothetical protein